MLKLKNSYFILRHVSLEKKKKNTLSSWPETEPLSISAKGRGQAYTIAKRLKQERIELIFSSDLLRTKETAEIIGKTLGLGVNFDSRLREYNFGSYNGKSFLQFYRDFPPSQKRFTRAPSGGESWLECQGRMLDFLQALERKYQGRKILIVGHGDPLWLLEGAMRGWSQKRLLQEKRESPIGRGQLRRLS